MRVWDSFMSTSSCSVK
jgi:hypothetical protein